MAGIWELLSSHFFSKFKTVLCLCVCVSEKQMKGSWGLSRRVHKIRKSFLGSFCHS